MILDLRDIEYEAWLQAVFDHPVADFQEDAWYWADDLEVVVDPIRQVEYLHRMCAEATALLDAFTPRQIDQGLWYIVGAGGRAEFFGNLWSPSVPWETRRRCIASIPDLWPGLFEQADVGTMSHMLWDCLIEGHSFATRDPESDPEFKRVQDAIFEALERQLTSSEPETQRAALHGFHHLGHPRTERFLKEFISSTKPGVVRNYAASVLYGEVI